MVGDDADYFDRARPAMDWYGKAVTLMGPSGARQLTKMVDQICVAGRVEALSEAMNLAQRAGLDGEQVLDIISKGAAQSWQLENRGGTMLKGEFDFGFAVDWMRKDLSICLDGADCNVARLPITAIVDQLYKHVQKKGGSRFDTSSFMRLVTENKAWRSNHIRQSVR
jgi:3-hydroxyisobutyrate dehydrogenase